MLETELLQILNPGHRNKRAIALATAGLLGFDAVINSFSGQSPLSNIGKGIAYTLGIATHKDLEITRDELQRQAQQISNVTVNQELLMEAQMAVVRDIKELRKAQSIITHEIAIFFTDVDNKINIYRLQNIVQVTLMKMVSAIHACKQQFTSPYVFGAKDLGELTNTFRLEGVQLTTDIDDVITSVILIENTYTFIIAVPLTMDTNDFFLYEVLSFPIFKDGKGFSINVKNKLLAINAAKIEYAVLTELEYDACTSYAMCTIASPFIRMTSHSPCEVRSLQHGANQCDLEADPQAQATFMTFGNITYFSVPEPLDIHLTCKNLQRTFNEQQQISHYGQFFVPDGCQVSIDRDISIKPGFVVTKYRLKDNTLFEILNTPFQLTNFPTTTPPSNITISTDIPFREIGNFKSTFDMVFDHETTVAGVIKFTVYFAIFALIVILIYLAYKPFRIWLNTFMLKTKPSVYWSRIRNYDAPEYRRRIKQTPDEEAGFTSSAPSQSSFNILQERLRQNIGRSRKPNPPPRNSSLVANLNSSEARFAPSAVPTARLTTVPSGSNPYINFHRLNIEAVTAIPEEQQSRPLPNPPVVQTHT